MRNLGIAFVFLLWALLTAACSSVAAQDTARTVVLGIDTTGSVARQSHRWLGAATKQIEALRPGDGLAMFSIHDHTANAPSLFDFELSPRDPGPGAPIEAQREFRRQWTSFRERSREALRRAFEAPSGAQTTDVFGIVDRLPAHPRGTMRVILFSDGLNSTGELDMERVKLQPAKFQDAVGRITAKHHWNAQPLANASVSVVLPAVESNETVASINDRPTLREFYELLVTTLGGRLSSFTVDVEE